MKKNLKYISSVILLFFLFFAFFNLSAFALTDSEYKKQLTDKGFPQEYAEKLLTIHKKQPNWEFNPILLNNTLIQEINRQGTSTWAFIPEKGPRLYTVGGYDVKERQFYPASKLALSYFMDPLNFIGSEQYIHMFEELFFNPNAHTVAAVQGVLNGTFMQSGDGKVKYRAKDNSIQIINKSYAQIIFEAGKKYNVNPVYLASKILLEVGQYGSSSVQGAYGDYTTPNYPEYRGYYNFFNWGAYGNNPVGNGLATAKKLGWSDPEKAILGGTSKTVNSYITQGQQTPYFQKFNINPNSQTKFPHQYMTSIYAPLGETGKTTNSYKNLGIFSKNRTFLIPVFKNYGSVDIDKVVFDYSTDAKTKGWSIKLRKTPGTNSSTIKIINANSKLNVYEGVHIAPNSDYQSLWEFPLWYRVNIGGVSGYVYEDGITRNRNVNVDLGKTKTLNIKKYPSNASECPMFMSKDTNIASVDQNGNVYGKKEGVTTISVFSKNGSFDTVPITVVDGHWIQDSKGWKFIHVDNSYSKNSWEKIHGKWYYFDQNGYMKTGWLENQGNKYYLTSSGAMAIGWAQINNKWYYFDSSGSMKSGWQKIVNTWYYLNIDGTMATGWVYTRNKWYYMNSSGAMQKGWVYTGGKWYYMNGYGDMQAGWVYTGNKWYYMDSSGAMVTGWIKLGNTWYYLRPNGDMATGWEKIGGRWYQFNSSGAWIK